MKHQAARTFVSLLPKPTSAPTPSWIIRQAPIALSQGQRLSQRRRYTTTAHPAATGYQTPNVASPATSPVYVLSLLTASKVVHTMNALRQKYYPNHLTALPAHLTLFHALPHSKLRSTIIPQLTSIAAKTAPYIIHAAAATRTNRGVLVHAHHKGPINWTRLIHDDLRGAWWAFLSKQDRSNVQLHWTVMNKVLDQAKVAAAHGEVQALLREKEARDETWADLVGSVEGLVLWRYKQGKWVDPREFRFGQKNEWAAREAWTEGGKRPWSRTGEGGYRLTYKEVQEVGADGGEQEQVQERDVSSPVPIRRIGDGPVRHIAGDKKARRTMSERSKTVRWVSSEGPDTW